MKINSIFVLTHDSIGMGEDGPTHQAVEQTATLRLVPNLDVWRPCDTVETFVAWQTAIEHRDSPTALVLTRQRVPHQSRDAAKIAAIKRGGYVLSDCAGKPDAVIIATGSEVSLAMGAQQKLAAEGVAVRVVSLPSHFIFERQDAAYRDAVLPRGIPRVAVEAGRDRLLAQVCRPRGRGDRHRPVRRMRPGRGSLQVLRHHHRQGRRSGCAASWPDRLKPRIA